MYIFKDQPELLIAFLPVGPFQQNQSIIACKNTGMAALVDCGDDPKPFVRLAREQGFVIDKLLQTHAHIDHVAGLPQTKALYPDAPLHLHPLDIPVYEDVPVRAQMYAQFGFKVDSLPPIDVFYQEGDVVALGDLRLRVMHTPGHAPGHVCLDVQGYDCVIGGDLLFFQSIGRTDLPGCDQDDMVRSLKRILTLPDATKVLPGHGQPTSIGNERKTNPFLQGL